MPIFFLVAIILILANRLADGLDGELARLTHPTDKGAFLDIVIDYYFYLSVPLGFALQGNTNNTIASALVLSSFLLTGISFLAYANYVLQKEKKSLLKRHNDFISTGIIPDNPHHQEEKVQQKGYEKKGFYFLGGLVEGTETIGFFIFFCLFPNWYFQSACVLVCLCLITGLYRVLKIFRS